MKRIYVVGTADTKGVELQFLAESINSLGLLPVVVDVGIRKAEISPDVSAAEVASYGSVGLLQLADRGQAVSAMAQAFAQFIAERDNIGGILGIGGSGGTAIVTAGMRALPIGVPKLMISTLASGDTAPYVGVSDILMMPSITDFAGLNRISRTVLGRAAAAITAMASTPPADPGDVPAVGLTMFGVTTPAVTQIVDRLGTKAECLVFHATGTGGRSMETLVDSGLLSAVIDITTTEVADMLFGGVLPAEPQRLDCIARRQIPYIGSVGACDMINFWAPETVPAKFAGRQFYHHNANVTLMRTTAEECAAIGTWIARKLSNCGGPVELLLPEKGVSALDIEGGPFFDPAAKDALFNALESNLKPAPNRRLTRLPLHINDPAFADAVVSTFRRIAF